MPLSQGLMCFEIRDSKTDKETLHGLWEETLCLASLDSCLASPTGILSNTCQVDPGSLQTVPRSRNHGGTSNTAWGEEEGSE